MANAHYNLAEVAAYEYYLVAENHTQWTDVKLCRAQLEIEEKDNHSRNYYNKSKYVLNNSSVGLRHAKYLAQCKRITYRQTG